jgi:hypothetical protein
MVLNLASYIFIVGSGIRQGDNMYATYHSSCHLFTFGTYFSFTALTLPVGSKSAHYQIYRVLYHTHTVLRFLS